MSRRRQLLKGAVLGVLSLGVPCTSFAQAAEPETVPMELLRTTSVGLPLRSHTLPEVLVGDIPQRLDGLVPIPPDGRVIGSLDYSAYSIVSVAVPGDPDTAREEWVDGLASLGWEPYSPPRRSGFVGNPGQNYPLCLGESRSMSLDVSENPEGGSYVMLISMDDERVSPCGGRAEPQLRRFESPIPALTLPPGARSGGGGSGGGGDEWHADARIRTDLRVSMLLDHYSAQLEAEGWLPGEKASAQRVAVQTFSVSDAEGQEWFAVLSASLPPGGAEWDLALRMVRR